MESSKPPRPPFKNRAERNAGYQTLAMRLFGDKEMILARPEGMNREEYVLLRKMQSEAIKRIFHKDHSPSRKLSGIMGGKEPKFRTTKGYRKSITQRKTS